jgi:hypothetical protein
MHSIFRSWNFMERLNIRRICFKVGSNTIPETQAELDHAKVSAEQWNDYQKRFVPFENKYLADVTANPALKENIVGGRVNADLAKQNNGAIPVGGINRIGSTVASNMIPTSAAAGAAAMATAKGSVRDSQIQGMLSAVNIGRGQAASAVDGMSKIASNAADTAQTNAESSWNRQSATQSAIMSGVGATAAATQEYYKQK